MPARVRSALTVVGILVGASVLLSAGGNGSAAAIQLQLADLLFGHADYRAAMGVYQRVVESADPVLSTRARIGTVRSALRIAEFRVAGTHAAALRSASPHDPATLSLSGDSLWASGLFDDAEAAYREALARDPGSARARNGVSKALASRNQLEPAREAGEAALAAAPDDPEIRHTVGYVYERLGRYDDAANQYAAFLDLLGPGDRADKAKWVSAEIAFLRSFKDRKPFAIVSSPTIRQHTVPFRLQEDKIIIQARFNGSRDPVDITLDTGAEHTVVTARMAKRLDLPVMGQTLSAGVGFIGLRGVQISRLDQLEIGSLKVRNLVCLVKSPSISAMLPSGELDSFSPLDLGLSVKVDYKARRVTLGEPDHDVPATYELPMRVNRLATVRGTVDGQPASFIVDTGGQVVSLNISTAESIFKPVDWRKIGLRVYGTSGIDPDAYLLPHVTLSFDPIQLPTQPIVVLNLRAPSVLLGYQIGGIIGHRFLSKYTVEINMEKSVLRLRES